MKKIVALLVLCAGLCVYNLAAAENSFSFGFGYGMIKLHSRIIDGERNQEENENITALGGIITERNLFSDFDVGIVTRAKFLSITNLDYNQKIDGKEVASGSYSADHFDWAALIGVGVGLSKHWRVSNSVGFLTDLGFNFNQISLTSEKESSVFYDFGIFAALAFRYTIKQVIFFDLGGEACYDFFSTSHYALEPGSIQLKSSGDTLVITPNFSIGVCF
jgi:hypothetical protein